MTFKEAMNFRLTFGVHKGKTIDEVAQTDEGLLYLDFVVGMISTRPASDSKEALKTYLEDPSIAKEVQELLDEAHGAADENAGEDTDEDASS